MPVIGFIPPIVGVDGEFNTFRLGKKLGSLPIASEVLLLDEKRQVVFGRAQVLDVTVGPLSALLAVYAHENHTQIILEGIHNHAENLYEILKRIYGPHIITPSKTATCIKLKRLE